MATYFILKVVIQHYNYFSFFLRIAPSSALASFQHAHPFPSPAKWLLYILASQDVPVSSRSVNTFEWLNDETKKRSCMIRNSAPLWVLNEEGLFNSIFTWEEEQAIFWCPTESLSSPLSYEDQWKTKEIVCAEILVWETDLPWEANSWTFHIYQAVLRRIEEHDRVRCLGPIRSSV